MVPSLQEVPAPDLGLGPRGGGASGLLLVRRPERSAEGFLEPLGTEWSNLRRRAMYEAFGSHLAYPTGNA